MLFSRLRPAFIIPTMAKQKNVTEALKAADQMEWGERAPVALKLRTGEKEGTGNLSIGKPPYRIPFPYGGIFITVHRFSSRSASSTSE